MSLLYQLKRFLDAQAEASRPQIENIIIECVQKRSLCGLRYSFVSSSDRDILLSLRATVRSRCSISERGKKQAEIVFDFTNAMRASGLSWMDVICSVRTKKEVENAKDKADW